MFWSGKTSEICVNVIIECYLSLFVTAIYLICHHCCLTLYGITFTNAIQLGTNRIFLILLIEITSNEFLYHVFSLAIS